MPNIGGGFAMFTGGVAQALLLFGYRWWAPLLVGRRVGIDASLLEVGRDLARATIRRGRRAAAPRRVRVPAHGRITGRQGGASLRSRRLGRRTASPRFGTRSSIVRGRPAGSRFATRGGRSSSSPQPTHCSSGRSPAMPTVATWASARWSCSRKRRSARARWRSASSTGGCGTSAQPVPVVLDLADTHGPGRCASLGLTSRHRRARARDPVRRSRVQLPDQFASCARRL